MRILPSVIANEGRRREGGGKDYYAHNRETKEEEEEVVVVAYDMTSVMTYQICHIRSKKVPYVI